MTVFACVLARPLVLLLTVLLALTGFAGQAMAGSALRPPDREVTVMTYNIHHGEGDDGVLDLQRIVDVIRDSGADIVGLQEVDRFWLRSGGVDQEAALARELGMHSCFGPNVIRDPGSSGDVTHYYGTLILSRYPILECSNLYLPKETERQEQRGLLETLINVRGVPLRFYNTHLQHDSANARHIQVDAIIEHIGQIDVPSVLVGDLNARPDDSELEPLYEHFVDAWDVAGTGEGYTIPVPVPTRRIDYVFVSPGIDVHDAQVIMNATTSVASDHFPVVAEIALPGSEVGIGKGRAEK